MLKGVWLNSNKTLFVETEIELHTIFPGHKIFSLLCFKLACKNIKNELKEVVGLDLSTGCFIDPGLE